jgi:hypothetical protein
LCCGRETEKGGGGRQKRVKRREKREGRREMKEGMGEGRGNSSYD